MNKYPKKTAGYFITSNVPVVNERQTVAEVEKLLINQVNNFATINYIYVINKRNKLLGVFSIKELFKASKDTEVRDLMIKNCITVSAYTNQEKVAMLALKNSLKAVPVVSKDKQFLGVLASDDLLKILDEEASDNLLKLSGVSEKMSASDNIFTLSIFESIKHRLPWLIIGLLGGIFTASLVANFEEILSQNIILAAFIPLLVYMSAAVSSQMQTFIIRDLFLNNNLKFLKYFLRQAGVVLIISIIISALLYSISFLMYQQLDISYILSLALFLTIITSLITGLIFPYVFSRLKLDPADVSGPIATIVQDILSILVYFLIASWFL
jgi:magnesium transporter